MKKFVLVFTLERAFNEDLLLVANNEKDLVERLTLEGYTDIKFSDLMASYGSCTVKDMYGTEVAKCMYLEHI